MFETLSNSLQRVFRNLSGYGKLSEGNIRDAMREVRMALLEADVNFQVVKTFTDQVRERCLGQEVLDSITPGQQVIKRVHEELVNLLGKTGRALDLDQRPALILLAGLHGSGKTTTAAKLAAQLTRKQGRRVLLVAADLRRPAAVDQLAILASKVGVPVLKPDPGEALPALGTRALAAAAEQGSDVVIYDTGGRFQIDDELVLELKQLRDAVRPQNILLVVDAAIGQESVNVAETFHRALGLTGLILTKLDGDARGGAALSIQSVTGCPILFTGTGEHTGDLEPFYPDRMASRILGMGDVVSLVEKVQQVVDRDKMVAAEKKLRSNRFNLEDFLDQMQQMKRMGPMENILKMLPGGAQAMSGAKPGAAEDMEKYSRRAEAIILSMTPGERRHPDVINGSRRLRIARGSGTSVPEVNDLLRQFEQARKLARKLGQMQKRLQFAR